MDKFIECLKNNDGAAAMLELESAANSFGFWRTVPDIVEQMRKECFNTAYIFCAAIVKLLSEKEAKHGRDGRMERCMDTAMQIADSVMPGSEASAATHLSAHMMDEVDAMQIEVDKKWLHPTVFQQIAQVPFLFFDSEELREKFNFDETWWRMPLI